MMMKHSISDLYDRGYEAPSTEEKGNRRAILEMEEEGEETRSHDLELVRPAEITLRLEMRPHLYENDLTIERIVNGKSGGTTPLYDVGNVVRDGSENLKPFSKARSVDFIYKGCGFYWDTDDMKRPFYEGHAVTTMIQCNVGDVIFRKPFAGVRASVRLETQFHRQARDEWTEVQGFGRNTYPLYPYGGYVPLQGVLTDMEPVYFLPSVDQKNPEHPVTCLKLYRSSFFHTSGGFPPESLTYDHKTWVFPHRVSALEQMTVGQALAEGHLTFVLKDSMGDRWRYVSYGYDQVGGSMTQVQVHCLVEEIC